MALPTDGNRKTIPVLRPRASQNLAIGGSSAASTAMGAGIDIVRLCATTNCRYAIGAAATATSVLLPAFMVEYVQVATGQTISVIQETAPGSLNIAEVD